MSANNKSKKVLWGLVGGVLGIAAVAALAVLVVVPALRYGNASRLLDDGQYEQAADAFAALGEYRDSRDMVLECDYRYALALLEDGGYDEAAEIFEELDDYRDSAEMVKECAYREAIALLESGKYEKAIAAFSEIKDYADSAAQIAEAHTQIGIAFMEEERYAKALEAFLAAGDYEPATTQLASLYDSAVAAGKKAVAFNAAAAMDDYARIAALSLQLVALESQHALAVSPSGKVMTAGPENKSEFLDTADWTVVESIVTGPTATLGLRADGAVLAAGPNPWNMNKTQGWNDIVQVAVGGPGYYHSFGVRSDGRVEHSGQDQSTDATQVESWTDIRQIACGESYTVGLKTDGTIVALGAAKKFDFSGWSEIVAISGGRHHIVGLKADGTVVATGKDGEGCLDVGDWAGIVAISAGDEITAGLRSDGTLVCTQELPGLSDWTGIVSFDTSGKGILAVDKHGKVYTSFTSEKVAERLAGIADWGPVAPYDPDRMTVTTTVGGTTTTEHDSAG